MTAPEIATAAGVPYRWNSPNEQGIPRNLAVEIQGSRFWTGRDFFVSIIRVVEAFQYDERASEGRGFTQARRASEWISSHKPDARASEGSHTRVNVAEFTRLRVGLVCDHE